MTGALVQYGFTKKDLILTLILRQYNISIEEGKAAIVSLLQRESPPTAVFASTEALAIGALQGARELNIKVPEELSIVGFDNTILSTICDPPLTTIAQSINEMGQKVVELIIEEIEKRKESKQRIVFSPALIIRHSTAVKKKS